MLDVWQKGVTKTITCCVTSGVVKSHGGAITDKRKQCQGDCNQPGVVVLQNDYIATGPPVQAALHVEKEITNACAPRGLNPFPCRLSHYRSLKTIARHTKLTAIDLLQYR
jgi:hypothetical protein